MVTPLALSFESKISFSSDQGIFGLLKLIDGLINTCNRSLELPRSKFVISSERFLEFLKIIFKISDINIFAL